MNYTENCHLPQWEENDRVLRTDFNEAFAALEEIGADHQRLRTMAGNLGRDLYRREVQSRVCHGKGGGTDGMWVNALETRESAGGDGHGWNGRYGVSFGPRSLPTLAGIKKTAQQISFVDNYPSSQVSDRAEVEFVSDGYGTLEQVMIWSMTHATITSSEYEFTITLTRMDTNTVVAQAGPFFTVSSSGGMQNSYKTVHFPLEANVRYRMSFTKPQNARYTGQTGFMLGAVYNDPAPHVTITGREAVRTIIDQTAVPENRGAIVLVRWKGEGTFALTLGGITPETVRTHDTINALGEPCKETELTLEQISAGLTDVQMETMSETEDFSLFDYGFIWQ